VDVDALTAALEQHTDGPLDPAVLEALAAVLRARAV
jgi:hypothetical protein